MSFFRVSSDYDPERQSDDSWTSVFGVYDARHAAATYVELYWGALDCPDSIEVFVKDKSDIVSKWLVRTVQSISFAASSLSMDEGTG